MGKAGTYDSQPKTQQNSLWSIICSVSLLIANVAGIQQALFLSDEVSATTVRLKNSYEQGLPGVFIRPLINPFLLENFIFDFQS